tara:strand:+ start:543 stop:842 length:300 start_codon:yes stop_codon:yes gene_type:complete
MKNKSKWKKFKDTITINGQEMSVIKYRCLSGCGCVQTKVPDRTKTCPGCDVNNSRRREAEEASSARVKGGLPKRKGGNFKEVDTEGGTPYNPPSAMKKM